MICMHLICTAFVGESQVLFQDVRVNTCAIAPKRRGILPWSFSLATSSLQCTDLYVY